MLETAWESRWLPDQNRKLFGVFCGGIAQLGEHLPCKQGVKGSNPFISTVGISNAYTLYLENRITNQSKVSKFANKRDNKTSEARFCSAESEDSKESSGRKRARVWKQRKKRPK